ncbi:MAG: LacI family transcriptional regulator [Leptolinea sp.]|jgi:LacI family transcriptional regulator|nr:LacI family transcriptional regulator [Leptolinea sp.]
MRTPGQVSNNITIFEVASQAGVSYGTVSRVLNNDPHVRVETREKVNRVIQDLGYVVNRQARSLAGGKTHVVGILVPDLGTGYIGEIIQGIDTELQLAGYDLMLYTTHRTPVLEADYVGSLAQGVADGLILVLPRHPEDYIGTLRARHFPFVLVDHQGSGRDCPAVGAANWQGAYNATEYLVNLGHTRIGFITGWMDLGAAVDRLEGYKAALWAYHIPFLEELVRESTFHQLDGYNSAMDLLNLPNPPTAIFASNDVMALGVMDAVREKGLKIPEDISIVGFDDIPQASIIHPALTTVRQPLRNMGSVATQMLLELLGNPATPTKRIELPTGLVVRDSCRPPRS